MRVYGGGHPSDASGLEGTSCISPDDEPESLSCRDIKTENVRPLASQVPVVVVLELEVGHLGLLPQPS